MRLEHLRFELKDYGVDFRETGMQRNEEKEKRFKTTTALHNDPTIKNEFISFFDAFLIL